MAQLGEEFDPTKVKPGQPGGNHFEGLPSMTLAEAETQFHDFLRSHGLNPHQIQADVGIQRFHTTGQKSKKNGYYAFDYNDGWPFGFAGCWSQGIRAFWRPDYGCKLSPQEELDLKAKIEARKREIEQEQNKKHEAAAQNAIEIYKASKEASQDHLYLIKKQVAPVGSLKTMPVEELANFIGYIPAPGGEKLTGQVLIVPFEGETGKLQTIGFIDENGNKSFLGGGKKSQTFWTASLPTSTGQGEKILIGEGVATVLSAMAATGFHGVAAGGCHDLKHVAPILKKSFPEAVIVVLSDVGNGQESAEQAAASISGPVAIPNFGDKEGNGTDFNDLAASHGLDEVKRQIESVLNQPPSQPVVASVAASNPAPSGLADPLPLPQLPPVPAFPLDILPDDLAPQVADSANRMQAPTDFVAVAAMVGAGAVIGRKLGMRLKRRDDWTEYANIWGLPVGDPSRMKSPAISAGLSSFKALQVAEAKRFSEENAKYQQEIVKYEMRHKARKKQMEKELAKNPEAEIDFGDDEPPKAPVVRTLWTSDVNSASLGKLLVENTNGLLIERDEMSSLLKMLDDKQDSTLRELFLTGSSARSGFKFNRIGRGEICIPPFAISVLGGIQPGPLTSYIRKSYTGESNDGCLQRFQLAVWPDSGGFRGVDEWPDPQAKEKVKKLFERLHRFDGDTIGERDKFGEKPPFVRLSPAAYEVFWDWYDKFMNDQQTKVQSAPLASHFGKYPGLLAKLTLIIHVCDDPESKEVSERTILKALGWIEYLIPHAERAYHAVEHPETVVAELLLEKMRKKELPDHFKAWEITRKQWRGLTDKEAVKKACRLLYEYGWFVELDAGGQRGIGRPADPIYGVSPKAMQ